MRKPHSPFLASIYEQMLMLRYAMATVEAYLHWIKAFIRFSRMKHPVELGEAEVQQFLSYLVTERHVAVKTQAQALNALVFLYRTVLLRPLQLEMKFTRSQRPPKLPTVLTQSEVRALLLAMPVHLRLLAQLMYGSGLRLMDSALPDRTTIMNFRHLLEQHQLARQLFKTINRWLAEAGVMMTQGTLVDATIIEAPSSTKNKEQQRDPQMHQTKKGNQWHFGMKAHIGVDAKSGLTHSLVTTAANEHDLNQLGNLLHGEEQFVSADAGYQGAPQREELAEVDVDWLIAERPGKVRTLKQHPRKNKTAINIEYMKASIRAKVEHPFRIIKRQFGFVKARYKGLLKNDNQLAMLFTLANLFRADQMIRQWERSH
ncbi:IS5 family transposase [Aeromonas caviae]|nr:IS5 family transposase [Aeromonas caviae]